MPLFLTHSRSSRNQPGRLVRLLGSGNFDHDFDCCCTGTYLRRNCGSLRFKEKLFMGSVILGVLARSGLVSWFSFLVLFVIAGSDISRA